MNSNLQIIRIADVQRITTLRRSTIYKKLHTDSTFPRPIQLSDSTARGAPIGFVLGEVLLWIESRISKREGK
ncbi:AlpA family phage regulatory protein [Pseudomonas sp. TMP9]|uniref:helix-turn-helix transcriptional regulator n=1 Tax=Pseudomonas sp. TMP9 TaxID=3133144 RepID=UPI0030D35E13